MKLAKLTKGKNLRLSDLVFEFQKGSKQIGVIVKLYGKTVGVIFARHTKKEGHADSLTPRLDIDEEWARERGLTTLNPDNVRSDLELLEDKVGKSLELFVLSSSSLKGILQGEGVGKRAYATLLYEAAKKGYAIGPSAAAMGFGYNDTSEKATRVWRKLKKLPGITSVGHLFYGGGLKTELSKPLKERARGFPRRPKKYRRQDSPGDRYDDRYAGELIRIAKLLIH